MNNSTIIAEIRNQAQMLEPILKRLEKGDPLDRIGLSFVQISHMRFQNNMKNLDRDSINVRDQEAINKYKSIYHEIEKLNDINSIKEKKNVI